MTADERKFSLKVVVAAIGILLAGWVGMALMGWDDKVPAQTSLVGDYANYPNTAQAQLPAGCDGNGVSGVLYSLNGAPPVASLAALPDLNAGDEVAMSWTSVDPACVGAPIVLAIKVAADPFFDPSDNQDAKVPYGMAIADGGPGGFAYTLPGLVEFERGCNYQLDAIVGLPLAVVGPAGSYYTDAIRQANGKAAGVTTLIGQAKNGAYETCEAPPPTTTSTTPETTTTTAPEVTTTTTPVETTTTTPPPPETTTTAPPVITCVDAAYGCTQPTPPTTTPPPLTVAAAAAGRAPMPNTGGGTTGLIVGLIVTAGGLLIFAATRKAARS